MKARKLYFYFWIKQVKLNLVSFTGIGRCLRFMNGLLHSCNMKLSQLENQFDLEIKKSMNQERGKQRNQLNKSTQKSLMKKNLKKAKLEISDYVISPEGQLCHKHLIALELNTIYQGEFTNTLMFGFDGK